MGSIGGGNVEVVAIDRARELLADPDGKPSLFETSLSGQGRQPSTACQCCGGTVTVLLEPLPVVPAVAIFGVGHVGLELARILARHDIELHLVDSRPEQLTDERLAPLVGRGGERSTSTGSRCSRRSSWASSRRAPTR